MDYVNFDFNSEVKDYEHESLFKYYLLNSSNKEDNEKQNVNEKNNVKQNKNKKKNEKDKSERRVYGIIRHLISEDF